MPTLLFLLGYRFFFYSNENNEPIYVHVMKAEKFGKIWLEPQTEIAYLQGFNAAEEKQILKIVDEYAVTFKNKWNEYFS